MTNICSHLPLVDGALGGEVVSPGGLHGRLIHGNHGTVGVGNQSEGTSAKAVAGTVAVTGTIAGTVTEAGTVAVAGTVGDRGSSVDTSNSDGARQDGACLATTNGKVVSTGGSHGRLVNRDHGTVGVRNQVGVQVEGSVVTVASSVTGTVDGSSDSDGGSSIGGSCHSDGASQDGAGLASTNGEVVSTGSSHSRLVNRDHCAVGVGNQVGVQVEGSVVTVASSVTGTVDGSSDSNRGSSIGGSSQDGAGMATTSGEVVSTGSSHSGLVNGNHGTVRVGHQVRVQVEGSGIAVASSIGGASGSIGRTSDSHGTSSQEGAGTKLSGQVVGLQGSHTRLIDGGDGPVGVRLQAEEALGGREGEGGGENQKLHCVFGCVLELKLRRLELGDLL